MQGEYAAAFHMRLSACIGIKILEVFLPRTEQLLRRSPLNTVFHLLAVLVFRITFIIEVVATILVDDVVVYATILGREKLLGLTLEGREVRVGVSIVRDEALTTVARTL